MFEMPSKNALRIKLLGYTFFFMLSKTQTVVGITSKVPDKEDLNYLFFDVDNRTLEETEKILKVIQRKYNLSNIYICSDKPNSFRCFCYSTFSLSMILHILTDSLFPRGFIDWNFIHWTVTKGKATLRVSPKKDREKTKCVAVLESYFVPIPETAEVAVYDTSYEKKLFFLRLGEKNRGMAK